MCLNNLPAIYSVRRQGRSSHTGLISPYVLEARPFAPSRRAHTADAEKLQQKHGGAVLESNNPGMTQDIWSVYLHFISAVCSNSAKIFNICMQAQY